MLPWRSAQKTLIKVRFKVDLSVLGHLSVRLHKQRNILVWILDGFKNQEGALPHFTSVGALPTIN